jgi:hypothetical protein
MVAGWGQGGHPSARINCVFDHLDLSKCELHDITISPIPGSGKDPSNMLDKNLSKLIKGNSEQFQRGPMGPFDVRNEFVFWQVHRLDFHDKSPSLGTSMNIVNYWQIP